MNKIKIIFKKIKFKLFALFGLLTIFGGCLLSNNSYAWFVNEQGNLESSNLYSNELDPSYTNNNVTMTFPASQSYCYLQGYNDSSLDYYINYNIFEGLAFDKTYTLSFTTDNSQLSFFTYDCWDNSIQYATNNNGVLTINLTEHLRDDVNWRFVVKAGFDSALPIQINIMVVEGSTPMAYEPFGKVYFNFSNSSDLQNQLDTLQDKYTLLETNYNQLSSDYINLREEYYGVVQEAGDYLDTIHQLNDEVATLTQLTNTLRTQVKDNFTWQNLFFTMADTPFRVVANALGFNIFGLNLFATFVGLTTTLAIIFLIKKFI